MSLRHENTRKRINIEATYGLKDFDQGIIYLGMMDVAQNLLLHIIPILSY